MSLVSQRFHRLVTTPPAWRIAFARYFPGVQNTLVDTAKSPRSPDGDMVVSERRTFTRLSALASWRSEYILRTRLLRSLSRGRPAIQPATPKPHPRQGVAPATAVVMYNSELMYPISHIHGTFGTGLNKKQPLFVHGASEQGAVFASDPAQGKIGSWGVGDFEAFKHFADLFVGESEYGLGSGELVGMPNVMDVSQPYGKIYGEALPNGRLFFTSTSEQRGRFLATASSAEHRSGIPQLTMSGCAVTSVWIAKSENVLKATNGLFGCMAGFSNGALETFALGVNPVQDRRFLHGEPTAKWVICPGVPLIAIVIDEKVNASRLGHRRIWATVLNALGEVYYLTDIPCRPQFKGKPSALDLDRLAWQTGRTVQWHLVEATRRRATADPFDVSSVDGSYTPRFSSDAQGLSTAQVIAETKEVEQYLLYKPKHFRKVCDGWDMRRKLFVDFAGDDHEHSSEAIFIADCGLGRDVPAGIRRYTRRKLRSTSIEVTSPSSPPSDFTSLPQRSFILVGPPPPLSEVRTPSPSSTPRSRTSSYDNTAASVFSTDWHISHFEFDYLRNVQINAVAMDESDFATRCADEDPLLGMSGGSAMSSPAGSPLGALSAMTGPAEVPGGRARFFAVGTAAGNVVIWNLRSTLSPAPDVVNTVQPLRIIHTKSPQIASLALNALYVVHGGNDGLVQAWDPLGSIAEPIRTLNSRFSDRARRRIAQAEASRHGVGNNYYAAGAIVLDPDPAALRGMVSLGTHLRYWHYSASAADAYRVRKRGQLSRRAERGSNTAASEQKFHHTGRSVLKDYIHNEKHDLEQERIAKRKEWERLSGRFGTTLLGDGASEEEMIAYATMLSEELYAQDEAFSLSHSEPTSAVLSGAVVSATSDQQDKMDADLEEAIRLSLLDSELAAESPQSRDYNISIKQGKMSRKGTPTRAKFATSSRSIDSPSADEDLDFAVRLSLAEHQSRMLDESDFPALSASASSGSEGSNRGQGKGKGKLKSSRQGR